MRRAGAAAVVALALLAAGAPAGAIIRPQKGMAGVRIGMTQAQMRAVLGEPRITRQGLNDFGPYTQFVYAHRIKVTFQGNRRVTGISTTGRSERTVHHVGVGSTERAVLLKVEGSKCETIARHRTCHVGDFEPGRRVTAFSINSRGRVTSVTIGIVLD